MKLTLLTTYYRDKNEERNRENEICLKKNVQNTHIDRIYLILQSDQKPNIENQKIEYVNLGRRPTFNDFFCFTNRLVDNNTIFIIANSDIYFDESITKSREFLKSKELFTLTRWDLQKDNSIKFYNKYLSQDTWIYKTKIDDSIGNYFIGQHGCDNRLLHELKENGINVFNPCFSIKSIHVHMSQLRTYFDNPNYEFVDPPYKYIFPNSFYSPFRISLMKVFNPIKYEKFKFSFSDYFYIRFEYYLNMSKNELQKMRVPIFKRILAFAPRIYYYFLFQIFVKLGILK